MRTATIKEIQTKEMIGIMPNTGDFVQEVRELRRELSKKDLDLDEVNAL